MQKTGGDSLERFAAELKRHKGQTVKAPVIRALMQPIGLAEKSYTYMLTRALEAKLVRRVGAGRGTATTYEVL